MIFASSSSSRIYVNLKFINYGFVVTGSTWNKGTGELKFEVVKSIRITQESTPAKLCISFPEGKYVDKTIENIVFTMTTNDTLTDSYEPDFYQGVNKNTKFADWNFSMTEFPSLLKAEEVSLKVTFQGSDAPLTLVLPKAMFEEWKHFLGISFEVSN